MNFDTVGVSHLNHEFWNRHGEFRILFTSLLYYFFKKDTSRNREKDTLQTSSYLNNFASEFPILFSLKQMMAPNGTFTLGENWRAAMPTDDATTSAPFHSFIKKNSELVRIGKATLLIFRKKSHVTGPGCLECMSGVN